MREEVGALARRIDGGRMRELLVDFVNLQGASEHSVVPAEWFAGLLRASGAVEARVYGRGTAAPVVVAGFPGTQREPTLQFMGYVAAPGRASRKAFAADGYVHGPAVASSAAGLLAAAEAARILATHGPMPGGGLLFTARAVGGRIDGASDIGKLIDMGIAGQAVVITSGPSKVLPVAGQGTCMFEVEFTAPEGAPRPSEMPTTVIDAAHALCGVLRRRHAAAARIVDGLTGPETIVVGKIGGGELFDTVPRSSWLHGAWRYGVSRTEAAVQGELDHLAHRVAATCGVRARVTVRALRPSYRVDTAHSPVHDLSAAYQAVWGHHLPFGGSTLPSDVPLFLARGIPAVCHGPRPMPMESNSDVECVSVDDMARLAEVYLRLSLTYLHHQSVSAQARWAADETEARDEKAGTQIKARMMAHGSLG